MTQVTTDQQYKSAIKSCRKIFLQKTKDYGTSWRVYRTISIADQIYIKAKRIRNIQEKGVQKIDDDVAGEFKGILNYAIIGLIQLDIHDDEVEELSLEETTKRYDEKVAMAKKLMEDKNHDYGRCRAFDRCRNRSAASWRPAKARRPAPSAEPGMCPRHKPECRRRRRPRQTARRRAERRAGANDCMFCAWP